MARTRQLKPDFFADEDLATRSAMARLLFAGLWTLADREGRLEDRPLKIKAAIFPYEAADVDALLDELARPKEYAPGFLLVRYEVSGRNYIQVCNFAKHQHPHPKELPSLFPAQPCIGKDEPCKATAEPGNSGTSRAVPSVPSVPSDTGCQIAVPSGGRERPRQEQPTLPPADRTERAIKATADGLRTKLYALVDEAKNLDPKGRDPTELMRLFTGYSKADGTSVRGVVNAALLTFERLEKSVEDAEAQIAEWKSGTRQRA